MVIPPSLFEVFQLFIQPPAIDLTLDFIVDVNTKIAK
jgi:hypothetical protein